MSDVTQTHTPPALDRESQILAMRALSEAAGNAATSLKGFADDCAAVRKFIQHEKMFWETVKNPPSSPTENGSGQRNPMEPAAGHAKNAGFSNILVRGLAVAVIGFDIFYRIHDILAARKAERDAARVVNARYDNTTVPQALKPGETERMGQRERRVIEQEGRAYGITEDQAVASHLRLRGRGLSQAEADGIRPAIFEHAFISGRHLTEVEDLAVAAHGKGMLPSHIRELLQQIQAADNVSPVSLSAITNTFRTVDGIGDPAALAGIPTLAHVLGDIRGEHGWYSMPGLVSSLTGDAVNEVLKENKVVPRSGPDMLRYTIHALATAKIKPERLQELETEFGKLTLPEGKKRYLEANSQKIGKESGLDQIFFDPEHLKSFIALALSPVDLAWETGFPQALYELISRQKLERAEEADPYLQKQREEEARKNESPPHPMSFYPMRPDTLYPALSPLPSEKQPERLASYAPPSTPSPEYKAPEPVSNLTPGSQTGVHIPDTLLSESRTGMPMPYLPASANGGNAGTARSLDNIFQTIAELPQKIAEEIAKRGESRPINIDLDGRRLISYVEEGMGRRMTRGAYTSLTV